MRCFDIRLMHLGKTVYMVGKPGTPSIQSDDLLVIGSGSGRTGSLVLFAEGAKKIGAEVLLFTIDPQSTLGKLADDIVQIPAPSPKIGDLADQHSSGQPMGNLFEQCLFALQDVLTIELMKRIGLTEKEMFARHANLE